MAEKYQWYKGTKFTRDDTTGYYLNSTIRKRMHIFVWEDYNGKLPEGYEVHHKDFDRSNNDISNLQLLTASEHRKLHADLLTDEQRDWRRKNLNETARPKAIEWHKSEEGKAWHREHYAEMSAALHQKHQYTCLNCGAEFTGESGSKFCSNNCKSAYRRKQNKDTIQSTCILCGKSFTTNKYKPGKTCSASCRAKLGHMK